MPLSSADAFAPAKSGRSGPMPASKDVACFRLAGGVWAYGMVVAIRIASCMIGMVLSYYQHCRKNPTQNELHLLAPRSICCILH